jgi:tetratricopeptide (TPR) repeat protein
VATSLNDIGVVYRRLGEYEKSLEYLKQSLEIKQKILGK